MQPFSFYAYDWQIWYFQTRKDLLARVPFIHFYYVTTVIVSDFPSIHLVFRPW